MVHGAIGSLGMHSIRGALSILHSVGNSSLGHQPLSREAQVDDVASLLQALPKSSPYRRSSRTATADEVARRVGDVGLFDMFLHHRDAPFSITQLLDDAHAAGLRATTFETPILYDAAARPLHCSGIVHPCSDDASELMMLVDRIRDLPARSRKRAIVGEILGGETHTHSLYFTRIPKDGKHDPDLHGPTVGAKGTAGKEEKETTDFAIGPRGAVLDWDLAPCPLNVTDVTMKQFLRHQGEEFKLNVVVDESEIELTMPPLSAAIVMLSDCRTPLIDIAEAVRLRLLKKSHTRDQHRARIAPLFMERMFEPQWKLLYDSLSGVGKLALTDHLIVGVDEDDDMEEEE